MTMIIDHRPYLERLSPRIGLRGRAISALAALADWLARRQAEHVRSRTARELEGLPFDMRKDLGWPADDTTPGGRR
jgi:hypothetical protein